MSRRMFALVPVLGALLLLLLGYLLLLPVGTLYAAPQATEWEVDRQDDPALPAATACTAADNDCSLRGAVSQAASGDTIVLAEAGTIQLGSQIVLTKNLTITSASAATHIIDGNDSTRIFLINAGRTILLDELTLQNGHSAEDGGAINMAQGTLTMTNVTLQNHIATGVGGALSVSPNAGTANVYLTNVDFINNHAEDDFNSGGAIHASANSGRTINLWIAGSNFTGNIGGQISAEERDGYGGAISATTLDGNSTLNLDIRNSTFISNESGYSGAIYLRSYARGFGTSTVNGTIQSSTFAQNIGEDGGGVHVGGLDGGSHATLIISNTTFISNSATSNGGGLYTDLLNRGDAPPMTLRTTIYNSSFLGNNAGERGGGIFNSNSARDGSTFGFASLELVNSTLSDNNSVGSGAALYSTSSGIITNTVAVTFSHATLFDNGTGNIASLDLVRSSDTTHSLYLKNSIIAEGGGLACEQSLVTIDGANNLIKDFSCGSLVSFRLDSPLGIVPNWADNGGETPTHALYAGSNALDAVPTGQCTVGATNIAVDIDQRGAARPFGTACDIGAFEAQSNSLPSQPPVVGLSASNDGPTLVNNSTTLNASITSGEGVVYEWDFGDGSTGTGDTATHTYTQTGTYTASVVASNASNSMTATTTVEIYEQVAAPITDLTASNDGPTVVPNATEFDTSFMNGVPSFYTWDFGDGSDGNGASPTHTYAASGVYTATVVATNETNSVTATTTVYVGDAVVEVNSNSFDPQEVTIPTNGTVVWVLRSGNHSVTADDDSFEQPAGTNWPPFIHTFGGDATVPYYCSIHGGPGGVGMAGTVIVGDGEPDEGPGDVPDGLRLPSIIRQDD